MFNVERLYLEDFIGEHTPDLYSSGHGNLSTRGIAEQNEYAKRYIKEPLSIHISMYFYIYTGGHISSYGKI